jgi:hypothetical protein
MCQRQRLIHAFLEFPMRNCFIACDQDAMRQLASEIGHGVTVPPNPLAGLEIGGLSASRFAYLDERTYGRASVYREAADSRNPSLCVSVREGVFFIPIEGDRLVTSGVLDAERGPVGDARAVVAMLAEAMGLAFDGSLRLSRRERELARCATVPRAEFEGRELGDIAIAFGDAPGLRVGRALFRPAGPGRASFSLGESSFSVGLDLCGRMFTGELAADVLEALALQIDPSVSVGRVRVRAPVVRKLRQVSREPEPEQLELVGVREVHEIDFTVVHGHPRVAIGEAVFWEADAGCVATRVSGDVYVIPLCADFRLVSGKLTRGGSPLPDPDRVEVMTRVARLTGLRFDGLRNVPTRLPLPAFVEVKVEPSAFPAGDFPHAPRKGAAIVGGLELVRLGDGRLSVRGAALDETLSSYAFALARDLSAAFVEVDGSWKPVEVHAELTRVVQARVAAEQPAASDLAAILASASAQESRACVFASSRPVKPSRGMEQSIEPQLLSPELSVDAKRRLLAKFLGPADSCCFGVDWANLVRIVTAAGLEDELPRVESARQLSFAEEPAAEPDVERPRPPARRAAQARRAAAERVADERHDRMRFRLHHPFGVPDSDEERIHRHIVEDVRGRRAFNRDILEFGHRRPRPTRRVVRRPPGRRVLRRPISISSSSSDLDLDLGLELPPAPPARGEDVVVGELEQAAEILARVDDERLQTNPATRDAVRAILTGFINGDLQVDFPTLLRRLEEADPALRDLPHFDPSGEAPVAVSHDL